ncbi:MAG TPA: family 1 glycosylhydrolase, partial [Verrucomicrobiae bacterium]|nr:family 1 glycosylhydrolase [Verrucomicrobiae bacterium]
WISANGGWLNRATVLAFADYVSKLALALRSRVRIWNTFNEPDTYVSCGYFLGEFPPLKKGQWRSSRKIIRHMAWAHQEACKIIRDAGSSLGPVEVGFSKNWTHFEPYWKWFLWDGAVAAWANSQFNEFVLEEFLSGQGSDAATYLGVNYYGRIRFKNFQALVPAFGFSCAELAKMGVTCDDMLERHPIGLESALQKIYQRARLPIYLTEHGSASDNETFRELDLLENLTALHRAIAGGVDVRGFYYWSLLDNFEWQFGYAKKFGLIGVDFSNEKLTRTMKPLGEAYRDVCLNNGI